LNVCRFQPFLTVRRMTIAGADAAAAEVDATVAALGSVEDAEANCDQRGFLLRRYGSLTRGLWIL